MPKKYRNPLDARKGDVDARKGDDPVWSVYILRCRDHSLYTGISTDVAKRISVHQSGRAHASKYVRSRHPVELVYQAEIGSRAEASRVEVLIKKLSKRQKEALVAGTSSLVDLGIVHEPP